MFFPRSASRKPTFIVDVGEARLGCYLRRQHAEAGTLLYFHGNGELAAEYDQHHAELFLGMGVNVCFAEYRGYGASTGAPALGAMLADGEKIVDALGTPPQRLVVFGRSLGSVYAIELARRLPGIAGVILESGIADLLENWPLTEDVDRLGCSESELRGEIEACFDHRKKLQGYGGRLLVLHTEHDQFLPPSHAERLHAWGAGGDKRLVVFPQGNHNSILFDNFLEYVQEVTRFLGRAGVAKAESKGAT